jgi:hypothetical protein
VSIEGTYGFVYSGANGLGVGIFTITGETFEGRVGGSDDHDRKHADHLVALAATRL